MNLRGSKANSPFTLAAGALVALALPALAQSTPPHVVPYTAEFRLTTVKTLADGTTITTEIKLLEARDSQSRTLMQNTDVAGPGERPGGSIAYVRDPANGTTTIWQSRFQVVYIQQPPPPDQRQGCWANALGILTADYSGTLPPSQEGNKWTSVSLGTKMIDGVLAQGDRRTRTIPTGQIGNSAPLVTTDEYWTAPSLGGLDLGSVQDDPQNGKMTRELISLTLSEPDPALFQPPPGYRIVTQTLHKIPCPETAR